jgi:hypothetical protein
MKVMRALPVTVAVACLGAFSGSTAMASEIVGSTLTQDPNQSFISPTTVVAGEQPSSDPTPFPLSPTTAGVVVSVRIKHGPVSATPGQAGLRVLGGTFTGIGDQTLSGSAPAEASNFAWPANAPAGVFTFIPTAGGAGLIPKGIRSGSA